MTERHNKYVLQKELFKVFERKIMRKIYGSLRTDDGTYRIRMNYELEQLMKGDHI